MADRVGGEAVFCHECGNRWPRDRGGLTCPTCSSDFVEILEGESANDDVPHPRRERSPSGFPGVLPTLLQALAPDHTEYTDDGVVHHQYRSSDGRFSFTSTTYRSPPRRSPMPGYGPGHSAHPYPSSHSPSPPDSFPDGRIPRSPGLGFLFGVDGLNDPRAPGRSSNSTPTHPHTGEEHDSYPNFLGPNPWQQRTQNHGHTYGGQRPPINPLQAVFQDLNNIRIQLGDPRVPNPPGVTPPHPLTFLAQILGMAHGGDAVYSQEEFDRVISQLMSQAGSTAPGPAPPEAIQALPKKAVDKTMLGDDGKAECSICMDDVGIGTEVTVLPCTHWFHGSCISAWLNEHDTCPHCRHGITSPPPASANSSRSRGANDTTDTPPLGSRANPFVVHDNSQPTDFQSGPRVESRAGAYPPVPPRPPRADGNSQNQSNSRGISGWMRDHFGGGPSY